LNQGYYQQTKHNQKTIVIMKVFDTTLLLCLASTMATTSEVNSSSTTTVVMLADENASIKACPCTFDGACAVFNTSEATLLQRLCIWSSTSDADLVSIKELALVSLGEGGSSQEAFVPLVPSPNIKVVCAPEEVNLCVVENVPLPLELFLDGEEGAIVTLAGSGNVSTSLETTASPTNLRGDAGNETVSEVVEQVEFQLQRSSIDENGISLTAVAVVSGIAVLLQSAYFLVRYMYSRSKAELPA
jgi:hypothetical protein